MLEQSSRRNLGEHLMHDNQWGYGNFSPYTRSYEHNSYDCYGNNRLGARNGYNDRSCKRVLMKEVRNERNYVNMDGRFNKERGDYEGYYDSYNHEGYSCGRSFKTLGTTSNLLVTTI
ncbi:hypothetical protein M9H77_12986 [Catharanthus roseus]|uniref:Uncharacterized protein n=1 Tax=Catharanthus roseus TaxID=4058 RepID=A0ACC0BIX8_CATRO|nr:hypothetical protein M9H77_12986 [Catharanthus roseus]